jgi:cytochrome o ubiquinol oxidase subunit 1
VTLALLGLDRYLGMHFFTNTAGGNPMLYLNLIWAWGHPEVYILILPAFGIFSDGSSPGPNDRLRLMYQGSRAVF